MLRISYLVILFLAPLLAHAGVNPRNGDFFVTYADATLSGKGHDLMMNRTYNSKSNTVGWFGFGWGSPFETRLTVMPDQTAVITENGNGADSFYHDESSTRSKKRVDAGVAKIVAAAKIQDKLGPDAVEALSRKLMGSEEERFFAVTKYHIQSHLPRKLKLTAYGQGYCAGVLQRTDTGYRRDDGCGKAEEFDLRGSLIKRTQNGGAGEYQITFRIENDHPVEISDSEGKSIHLSWTQDGQVNRLTASDGTVIEYEYDNNHNLTLSNNLAGPNDYLFYRHDYDRNHNMTRIRYLDGSSMYMTYTANGLATSVTERSGERKLYEYSEEPDDQNKYSTRIRAIAEDGSETSETVGYQDGYSATGERHLQSYSVDGQQCDASTQLDEKGRITSRKTQSGEFIAYTYHPTLDKVVAVKLDDRLIARYQYNPAGDLTHAEDTLIGRSVDLEYDEQKHISHMRTTNQDGSHDDLTFKYNEHGNPVEIKHAELGTVKVQYDDKGEISEVKSEVEGGAHLAIRITEMFQGILRLAKIPYMSLHR